MGKPFLKGYVSLAEGEKDPRNLMYLFTMNRVILIEWELDEELAEVSCSC
jgi:DNA repair/transcription protein MET18/MMS19